MARRFDKLGGVAQLKHQGASTPIGSKLSSKNFRISLKNKIFFSIDINIVVSDFAIIFDYLWSLTFNLIRVFLYVFFFFSDSILTFSPFHGHQQSNTIFSPT